MTVCQTKKSYDSEFEAQRAAAITEHRLGEAFAPYQCSRHWHITHVDRQKRRGVGHRYSRCPHCKNIFSRDNIKKHKCEVKERLHGD